MSERAHKPHSGSERGRGVVAAEVAAAAVAAAAIGAGTKAYVNWRRRNREMASRQPDPEGRGYEQKAAILNDPRLSPVQRDLMAAAAVRIYANSRNTRAGILTRPALHEELSYLRPEVSKKAMQNAVSYLVDNDLVKMAQADDGSGKRGYRSQPALDAAVLDGESFPTLADAQVELFDMLGGFDGLLEPPSESS